MGTSLDKLTIKGFKSIRELIDFELKDLNVFIGGNGAGKSNLIDFFRLLRHLIEGNLTEFIRSGGGISDFLFNGRKVTKRWNLKPDLALEVTGSALNQAVRKIFFLPMKRGIISLEQQGGGNWGTVQTELVSGTIFIEPWRSSDPVIALTYPAQAQCRNPLSHSSMRTTINPPSEMPYPSAGMPTAWLVSNRRGPTGAGRTKTTR